MPCGSSLPVRSLLTLVLPFAFVASLSATETGALVPGRLIEKVVCAADATQSYSLYLPSNYDPAKKWPVLFCFDPGALGQRPVAYFQSGAEQFGYIVAGSNNSRNGPWLDIAKAIEAMSKDVRARCSINSNRIYTAGFSGGARVATQLGLLRMACGVIACGGAFLPNRIPDKVPFLFFGASGTDDFNHGELSSVDEDLDKIGANHRVVTFAGGHEWPPVATATEAIEWLEIQSMRSGLREKIPALIEASYRRRLAGLSALPIAERWRETKSLAADFKGLADTSGLEISAADLAKTRELRDWLEAEKASERRQTAMVQQWMSGVSESTVASWRKRADSPVDSQDRQLARRVLQEAFINALETARGLSSQGSFGPAGAKFELASMLQPGRAGTWFELARVRALNGERKESLKALKKLAALGYKDRARLEQEPAFKGMQKEAAFQEMLQAITANCIAEKTGSPIP